MSRALTIGFLAEAAAVNIETVRYYQRLGLLQEPQKPATGYRVYPSETVDRIRFIKRAQTLGFSLNEISGLLEISDGHCDDVRLRAEEKKTHIEKQIKDLKKLQRTLDKLIKSCQSGRDIEHCPIIETLMGK